ASDLATSLSLTPHASRSAGYVQSDSDGSGLGTQGWTFSKPDNFFDFLAAGETLTAVYTVTFTDKQTQTGVTQQAATVSQDVTITVTGTNDSPTVTANTLAELAHVSGQSTAQTVTGAIGLYADTQTPSVSGSSPSLVWSGGVLASTPTLNFALNTITTSGGLISQPWTFSAADSSLDFLADGQTLTATYGITLGGNQSSQNVVITMLGRNDLPSLTAPTTPASYVDTHAANTFSAVTGTLTASDPDAGTTISYGILGSNTASLIGGYGTLTVNTDTGAYTYTPNAAAINGLPASASVSDLFTLTASDGVLMDRKTLTIPLTGANDEPIGAVTLSGTAQTGQVLTANTGSIQDADGLGAFSYQWQSAASASGTYSDITGATSSTYTPTHAVFGQHLKVKLSYTDGGDATETLYSSATTATTLGTTAPSFSGGINAGLNVATHASATVITNTLLHAVDPDQANSALTYTLTSLPTLGTLAKSAATLSEGSSFTQADIDAGLVTYTPSAEASGNDSFRFDLSDGASGSLTQQYFGISIGHSNTAPTGTPTVETTASRGQTLTVDTSTLADVDGLGSFSYQWQASANGTSNWSNISGATGDTYTVGNYAGQSLRAEVSYVDAGRTSETLDSTAITINANETPVLSVPATLTLIDITPATTDTFPIRTGMLTATDANTGDTLSYGISSGATATASTTLEGLAYNTVKTGTYGNLYLNSTTGFYAYVPNASAINALDRDTTTTETFTVTASDGLATANQTLTVNLKTAAAQPESLSYASAGSVTESSGTANSSSTQTTGTIRFADVDLNDTHSLTKTVHSLAWSGGTLTADQTTQFTNAFTLVTKTDSTATGAGTQTWQFSVTDSTLDFLTAGETLTAIYTVTVADNQASTVAKDVLITVNGRNDAPTLSTATVTGSYTEAAATSQSLVLASQNGAIGFTDVDLNDTHNVTETVASLNWSAGSLSAAQQAVLTSAFRLGTLSDSTGTGAGTQPWTFQTPDQTLDFMSAEQTLTAVYAVKITDSQGSSTTQNVTVTLTGANDSPVGFNDAAVAVEQGGIANATAGTNPTGNVLNNDTDVDSGDTRTVSAITGGTPGQAKAGTYGSLTLNSDGTYTYTVNNANADVQGLRSPANTLTDSFIYTVRDAGGLTDTATLTVTITGRNDNPVGVDDTATATEAGGVNNGTAGTNPTGNVLTNDTDVDSGDTRTVTGIRTGLESTTSDTTTGTVGSSLTGTYGSLTVNADGSYIYTVDNSNTTVQALQTGQALTDSFTYTVRDTGGLTDTATLTVTITGRNDNPVGVDDTATATEAGGVNNATAGVDPTGNVLTNDTDVDSGDTRTVTAVRLGETEGSGTVGTVGSALIGTYGTLTLASNGAYTYAVNNSTSASQALAAGESAIDTFNYTVTDAGGLTDTAVLRITVNGSNDAPTVIPGLPGGLLAQYYINTGTSGDFTSGTLHTTRIDSQLNFADGVWNGALPSNVANANEHFAVRWTGYLIAPASSFTFYASHDDGFRIWFNNSTATPSYTNWNLQGASLYNSNYQVTGLTPGQAYPIKVEMYENGSGDAMQLFWQYTGVSTQLIPSSAFRSDAGTYSLAETASTTDNSTNLQTTGTIYFQDVDLSDTHTATPTLTSLSYTNFASFTDNQKTALNTAITNALGNGLNMATTLPATLPATGNISSFTLGTKTDSTGTGQGTQPWTFTKPDSAFDFLAAGETVAAVYTVTIKDNQNAEVTQDVTVTITGTNDAPDITVGDNNSASATLTETSDGNGISTTGVNTSGTLTVTDVDITNTVTASVLSVATSGTTTGLIPNNASLLAMMSVSPANIIGNSITTAPLTWTFNSGSEAFNYLATGQNLTLTYTLKATDSNATPASDTQAVVIKITGTNDAPIGVDDTVAATEAGGINNGTAGTNPTGNVLTNDTDVDATDTKTVTEIREAAAGSMTSVTSGTTSSNGQVLAGTYGSLKIGADGSYAYTVDNSNTTVQALQTGQALTDSFTYTVRDTGGLTDTATLTVTIAGRNDAPVTGADTSAVTELDTLSVAVNGVLANDSDRESQALTVTGILSGTSGTATAVSSGTAGVVTNGYGTLTLYADGHYSFIANGTDAIALAEGVTQPVVFTYTASDGMDVNTNTLTITITGINNYPVITQAHTTASYTEQGTAVTLDSGIVLSDTDSTQLSSARISISSGYTAGDVLGYTIPAGSGISGSYASGTLNFTGTSSLANYQSTLASITYSSTSDDPTQTFTTRTINWQVKDDPTNNLSIAGTNTTLTVIPVNDAPVFNPVGYSTGIQFHWFAYSGNMSSSAYIDGVAELKTSNTRSTFYLNDNILQAEVNQQDLVFVRAYANLVIPDVSGSTYQLNLRTYSDDGVQVWVNAGSGYTSVISNRSDHGGTYDTGSIQVPDNSIIPIEVEYWENGGGAVLDVQWGGSSGGTNYVSIPASSLVYVTTATHIFTVTEDVASNLVFTGTNLFSDVDNSTLTVTLAIDDGTIVGTTASGITIGGTATARTFTGTPAHLTSYFTTSGNVTYQTAQDNNVSRTLNIDVSDGTDHTSTNYTVNITPVNDAPVFTATPTPISLTDTAAVDTFANQTGTLSASDIDSTTLTYGIGSGNSTTTTINSLSYNLSKGGTYGTLYLQTSNGNYVFVPNATAINARSANTSETYTLTLSDDSLTTSNTLTVNITGANDAPVLTDASYTLSNATEDTPYTISYNTLLNTVLASDVDNASRSFLVSGISSGTLSKSGVAVTAGSTVISSGESLVWTPDTNANGTLAAFTVKAYDGVLSSANAATINVSVAAVNDAPVRTAGTLSAITVNEDSASAATSLGLAGITYGPGGGSDETGQTVTATITGIPSFLTLWKSDGVTQVTANTSLTLSELQGLTYKTVANANGTGTITWTVTDNGSSVSPNINTLTESLSVTVNAVNDAPIASGSATLSAIAEDTTNPPGATVSSLFAGNFSDSTDAVSNGSSANTLAGIAINSYTNDSSKGAWQYSSDGSTWTALSSVTGDATAIVLKAADFLRFVPALNYNGFAPTLTARLIDSSTTISTTGGTLNVSSNGGTTAYSSATVTLNETITAVNDAPGFTKGADQTIDEDAGTQTVAGWATSISTGPSNESSQTVNFIVSNSNNALFSVQPTINASGNLVYTPASNANGTATVTVQAHDTGGTSNGGVDTSAAQTFSITVNPVNDAPVMGVGLSNISVANASFETGSALSQGWEKFTDLASQIVKDSWTYAASSYGAGVAKARSPWYTPDAPDGVWAAFVQMQGSISQTLNLPGAGTYLISFYVVSR
ncbi:MAG: VCBS domain-containing protein, partial [Methylococcaceae bacterium]